MIDKRLYNSYMVKPGITVNIPKNDGKVTIENYGDEAYWGDFYLSSETGAYSVTLEGVKFGTDQYKKDLEEDGHVNITFEPVAKDSNKRNRLDLYNVTFNTFESDIISKEGDSRIVEMTFKEKNAVTLSDQSLNRSDVKNSTISESWIDDSTISNSTVNKSSLVGCHIFNSDFDDVMGMRGSASLSRLQGDFLKGGRLYAVSPSESSRTFTDGWVAGTNRETGAYETFSYNNGADFCKCLAATYLHNDFPQGLDNMENQVVVGGDLITEIQNQYAALSEDEREMARTNAPFLTSGYCPVIEEEPIIDPSQFDMPTPTYQRHL